MPDTFDTTRTELWTGVTILDNVPFDTLQLWLATTTTGFCRLDITPGMDPAVVSPPERNDAATIITGTSLAYMTWVKTSTDTDGRSTWEFVIHAYGPHAEPLAQHMADQIRTWDREHRHSPGPRVNRLPPQHPRRPASGRLGRGQTARAPGAHLDRNGPGMTRPAPNHPARRSSLPTPGSAPSENTPPIRPPSDRWPAA
ncbi:MAG: protein-L-isoaspartate(D-aspartate) O-methyltransferase [Streptomyces sp.]|nr:protein-L-isoaspartate(D-aspartate) O-methyltransferase [Streptomyces sp.]